MSTREPDPKEHTQHDTSTPPPRPSRADSPTWQRVEAIGQAYLRLSRQIAHVVSAAKKGKN